MKNIAIIILLIVVSLSLGGFTQNISTAEVTASQILGNSDYLAFSYGGYRENTRESVPTIGELKEDLKILHALNVKVLRTYNTKQYGQAANLLEAMQQVKDEDSNFEMYVMLGTWIECEDAWTATANHKAGNVENNTAEIEEAIMMANQYPDIVKVIAVGNEAMVQWAVNYFV